MFTNMTVRWDKGHMTFLDTSVLSSPSGEGKMKFIQLLSKAQYRHELGNTLSISSVPTHHQTKIPFTLCLQENSSRGSALFHSVLCVKSFHTNGASK